MSSRDGSVSGGGRTEGSQASQARARRRKGRLRRRRASDGSLVESGSGATLAEGPPKPRAIDGALFMWEEVASFCEPRLVCELERLCTDVAGVLAASNKSTRLMQRYWNAQWARMVWREAHLPREKRLLLPTALPRSGGRVSWKRCFVEEYPLWLQRTVMGKGANERAYDDAKVLFHRETLNAHVSAQELAAMELSVEEALCKAMAKRGIEAGIDGEKGPKALVEDPKKLKYALKHRGEGSASPDATASPLLGKGRSCLNLCLEASQENLTREDYQFDHRQGSRKGKHKKGLNKKWSSYDNFGDYNY